MSREPDADVEPIESGLSAADASTRLRAALRAGTEPDPTQIRPIVERLGIEPDFFVRDMLTWALAQNDHASVGARLVEELTSSNPAARAQALHGLSKIDARDRWRAITPELLADPDDEVARTAWRTAVALWPIDAANELASRLATQWARGGREIQLSLSQALVGLGDAADTVIDEGLRSANDEVRRHARATERLQTDPDSGWSPALAEAARVRALGGAPTIPNAR